MLYELTPMLTERDEAEAAEGGIDPLGLYTIADTLGIKLVPGVRERQQHPRFLTAVAVSLEVCRGFDEEAVASDGVSEPWLVFEWYLVEGLVRRVADGTQTSGLPGSRKARRAIEDNVPLSAKRYLKTPSVFGFHGIYRLLARTLGVEEGGRLGEAGQDLLAIWAKEQGLEGFTGATNGPGRATRQHLCDAVQAGLDQGGTARSNSWSGWRFFADHLGPYGAGTAEAKYIASMLARDGQGFRREVIEFLTAAGGTKLWKQTESEREFHRALRKGARAELRSLLDAIDSYETFSRLCQDAFDDCLLLMTSRAGKTSPLLLGGLPSVQKASREVPAAFAEVRERLVPFGEAQRFTEAFGGLAEPGAPADWADRLARHHEETQDRKPPEGKAHWFHRLDGGYIIRTLYKRDHGGRHDGSYVHAYRTRSLWSFAQDFKLVRA